VRDGRGVGWVVNVRWVGMRRRDFDGKIAERARTLGICGSLVVIIVDGDEGRRVFMSGLRSSICFRFVTDRSIGAEPALYYDVLVTLAKSNIK